jgi:uncharacterized protein YraI
VVIYSNWVPLSSYPISQDESGPSHIDLKYASGVKQLPIDFAGQKVDFPLTLDVDCKVTYSSKLQGNYCIVQAGEFKIMFVHVYQHAAVGSTVKAGGVICRIAPTTLNGGYAVHLHISGRKNDAEYAVRNIIFNSGIHVGVKVEFLADTNIRQGNGTSYPIQDTAKAGAVAEIIGGPRNGDGYTWFDVRLLSGTGWAIDKHMKVTNKEITFPDGSVPIIDPCAVKLEAQKRDYEKQLFDQKTAYEKQIADLRGKAHLEVPILEASASRLKSL